MTVTSLPTMTPERQRLYFRRYALHRMEIGPAAHTVHYGMQALSLGSNEDEVTAALRAYLGTDNLQAKADEQIAALIDQCACFADQPHDAHAFTIDGFLVLGGDTFWCGGRGAA